MRIFLTTISVFQWQQIDLAVPPPSNATLLELPPIESNYSIPTEPCDDVFISSNQTLTSCRRIYYYVKNDFNNTEIEDACLIQVLPKCLMQHKYVSQNLSDDELLDLQASSALIRQFYLPSGYAQSHEVWMTKLSEDLPSFAHLSAKNIDARLSKILQSGKDLSRQKYRPKVPRKARVQEISVVMTLTSNCTFDGSHMLFKPSGAALFFVESMMALSGFSPDQIPHFEYRDTAEDKLKWALEESTWFDVQTLTLLCRHEGFCAKGKLLAMARIRLADLESHEWLSAVAEESFGILDYPNDPGYVVILCPEWE